MQCLDQMVDPEAPDGLRAHFEATDVVAADEAVDAVVALREALSIGHQMTAFLGPLQRFVEDDGRLHFELNLGTETGRTSCKRPNLQNQPSVRDPFGVRRAFTAKDSDHTLIVADYAQIELRVLALLADCQSMLSAFESGGDFHSQTAASMYSHIQDDLHRGGVAMDEASMYSHNCNDGDGETQQTLPTVKQKYKKERLSAKTVNFRLRPALS